MYRFINLNNQSIDVLKYNTLYGNFDTKIHSPRKLLPETFATHKTSFMEIPCSDFLKYISVRSRFHYLIRLTLEPFRKRRIIIVYLCIHICLHHKYHNPNCPKCNIWCLSDCIFLQSSVAHTRDNLKVLILV